MFLNLTFYAMAVAGLAVCWRNLLVDLPGLARVVDRLPYLLRKSLRCGFCSTFWLALVTVLLFEPLPQWTVVVRFTFLQNGAPIFSLFAVWMIVGLYAVCWRFGYVVLQELVHYQVHYLRNDKHTH